MITGVDIPDLEFIVFLRPVKSRILFEQMLGRGTRKGERHLDKSHFTVFDCFDGTLLEYFRNATGMTGRPARAAGADDRRVIEDIWQNRDRDYNVRCLVKRLQRIDKEMSRRGRASCSPPSSPTATSAASPGACRQSIGDDFTGADEAAARTRSSRTCSSTTRGRNGVLSWRHGVEDTVTSRVLIRDADGDEYKPDDYLDAFAASCARTRRRSRRSASCSTGRGTGARRRLTELRRKLAASRQRFTEELCRRPTLRYQKALVDIISMVKHAADGAAAAADAPRSGWQRAWIG